MAECPFLPNDPVLVNFAGEGDWCAGVITATYRDPEGEEWLCNVEYPENITEEGVQSVCVEEDDDASRSGEVPPFLPGQSVYHAGELVVIVGVYATDDGFVFDVVDEEGFEDARVLMTDLAAVEEGDSEEDIGDRVDGGGEDGNNDAAPCESCEEKTAVMSCDECAMVYCEECAVWSHKRGALAKHALHPLVVDEDKPPVRAAVCEACEEAMAVSFCEECAVSYCEGCREFNHDRVGFETHAHSPLEEVPDTCDACEEVSSALYCAQCVSTFCIPCCELSHDRVGFEDHVIVDMHGCRAADNGAMLCDACEEVAAVLSCVQCESSYCEGCSTFNHQREEMSNHTLAEISDNDDSETSASDPDVVDDVEVTEDTARKDKPRKKAAQAPFISSVSLPNRPEFAGIAKATIRVAPQHTVDDVIESVLTKTRCPQRVGLRMQDIQARFDLAIDGTRADRDVLVATLDIADGTRSLSLVVAMRKANSSLRQSSATDLLNSEEEKGAHDVCFDGDVFNVPFTTDNLLLQTKGETLVRAGTVECLVALVTHENFSVPSYTYAFAATFPTFLSPQDFLKLLLQRLQQGGDRIQALAILHAWVYHFRDDFARSESLLTATQEILGDRLFEGLEGEVMATSRLLGQLAKPNVYTPPRRTKLADSSRLPKDFSASSFARTLFVMDEELFVKIGGREYLDTAWSKKNKETDAPNLLALIRHSTHISSLVATTIISEMKTRRRGTLIQLFVEAAQEARFYDDYAGVAAILAGLNMSSVHRLRKSWALIPDRCQAAFDGLVDLTSRGNNNYRHLKASYDGAESCIPYIGTYLTDLTFIEDGNPDQISAAFITLCLTSGKKKVTRKFNGRDDVQVVHEAFIEMMGDEKLPEKHGMFIAAREKGEPGQWLDANAGMRIFDYDVFGGEVIEWRTVLHKLRYRIPGGNQSSTTMDITRPVRELIHTLVERFQMKNAKVFYMFVDVPLDPSKALWMQGVGEAEMVELRMDVPAHEVKELRDDERLLDLLYSDARDTVRLGEVPVDHDTGLLLAILAMQAEHGKNVQCAANATTIHIAASADGIVGVDVSAEDVAKWQSRREADVDWYLAKVGEWPTEADPTFVIKQQLLVEVLERLEGSRKEATEINFINFLSPSLAQAFQESGKGAAKIKAEISDLLGHVQRADPQTAKEQYAQTIKDLPTAGGRFFACKMKNTKGAEGKKKKGPVYLPIDVGASPSEFFLLDGTTKEIKERLPLEDFMGGQRDGVTVTFSFRHKSKGIVFECEDLPMAQMVYVSIMKRFRALVGHDAGTARGRNAVEVLEAEHAEEDAHQLINFTKRMRTATIIQTLMNYEEGCRKRAGQHGIKGDVSTRAYIDSSSVADENALHEKSLKLEARGGKRGSKRPSFLPFSK